jgi:AraC family transcriptional regulator of adaptative response/methylated-DNA-[protein]-cysteine methyltransferase
MTLAEAIAPERAFTIPPFDTATSDYEVVRRAIAHISANWQKQPSVEEIAAAVSVGVTDLHHIFRRWAGLTPKDFLAALTIRDGGCRRRLSRRVRRAGPGRPRLDCR